MSKYIWKYIFCLLSCADTGLLSDLWQWSVQYQSWSLISGNNKLAKLAVYGIQGFAAPENHPGGRELHSSVVDERSGVLLIFGGNTQDQSNVSHSVFLFILTIDIGFCNDFWLFDPDTRLWTWIAGSSQQYGQYFNTIKKTSIIGSRHSHTLLLPTNSSAIYIFGGYGLAEMDIGNKTWFS